jgi:hypothetical protein
MHVCVCEREKGYPSGFDEALSDAVEERVAEVKEATLLEATQLIEQRPCLQVTVAHLFCSTKINEMKNLRYQRAILRK